MKRVGAVRCLGSDHEVLLRFRLKENTTDIEEIHTATLEKAQNRLCFFCKVQINCWYFRKQLLVSSTFFLCRNQKVVFPTEGLKRACKGACHYHYSDL